MKAAHFFIVLVAIVALSAGVLVKYLASPNLGSAAVENLRPANLFTTALPAVDNKERNLRDWRGKTLVVNFWATWCPPCLKEIPEFMALQTEYAAKNVQFIGIAIDDKSAVADYLAKVGINYPILIAGDAGIGLSKQWGNLAGVVPYTIVINKDGLISHAQLGEFSRNQILAVFEKLALK